MKYTFGDSVLGESLRTLFALHFVKPKSTRFSSALKDAGYAVFGDANILNGTVVDLTRRATITKVASSSFVRIPELMWGIRIPLHGMDIHKISLVIFPNSYTLRNEYCLQVKMTPGSPWATVATMNQRAALIEIIERYTNHLQRIRIEMREQFGTDNPNWQPESIKSLFLSHKRGIL